MVGLLDDAEVVEVGVIDGEVDEDSSGGAVNPQVSL